MRRILAFGAVLLGVAVVAYALLTEMVVANVAEPPYDTLRSDGDYSVREYQPMILASVEVTGARGAAANAGFRPLAAYIFGDNTPRAKIAMTAPVVQEPVGEEIAMTAPVIQEPADTDRWIVRFVMPANYDMSDLPVPDNPNVVLDEVPAETVAVVRFTGLNTEGALNKQTARLRAWIEAQGLQVTGGPRFAFYDPPWTIPFLRRNEVIIPVAP